jgi:hypothetical protein
MSKRGRGAGNASKRGLRGIALAILLLATGAARAETLVFQEGTLLPGGGAYASTQDTEADHARPNLDLGASDSVRSDLDSFGAEAQGLLRYGNLFGALPDRIPPGSTISSAVLTLEVFNKSNDPTGIISVHRMTTAWNASSTWNTLVDGVGIGVDTLAVADDAHTIEAVGTASFDVLASLQAWSQGDANFGWVFVNDSTDGIEFRSSEYATVAVRPLLTVSFTPPETTPAVPALARAGIVVLVAGLALLGVARSRMRK